MTTTDAITELNALQRREPFTPFVIVLSDGRRLPVNRRLQFGVQERLGIVLDEQDRICRFKPTDVVSIELAAPAPN
jgi:hypothetical protein